MGVTSYVVELHQDEREILSASPSAAAMMREIELAAADGWMVHRIHRDCIEISETELRRDAEASPLKRAKDSSG